MRAFAALSVMLAHLVGPSLPGVLKYTFTGHPAVIAFFVISGFCIHYPFINRPLPVWRFLAARATRILPPVFLAMAAAYVIGIKEYNFVDGYILWSVVCELWYYALYPLFLILSRYVPWHWQWLAACLASYGLVLALGSDQYGNAHIYGPLLTWVVGLPSWLTGCVVANMIAKRPRVGHVYAWRVCVGLTASTLFWLTIHTPVGFYLSMNVFAVLVALWMLAEVEHGGRTVFDWVGQWSFSIYLWHVIAGGWLAIPVPLMNALGSLVVCYVAYLAVERPSHKAARKLLTTAKG